MAFVPECPPSADAGCSPRDGARDGNVYPSVTVDRRLPRAHILKSARRISELFKCGKRLSGRFLQCYYLPSERPQAAFIVPKRYGSAVRRNRQKRRLRELYRLRRELFPPNCDLVLYLPVPRKSPRARTATRPPVACGTGRKTAAPAPSFNDLLEDLHEITGSCTKHRARRCAPGDQNVPGTDLTA